MMAGSFHILDPLPPLSIISPRRLCLPTPLPRRSLLASLLGRGILAPLTPPWELFISGLTSR